MDYHIVWYILVGVLLTGYAILDGFDLGVGALHLFSKGDRNRRILLNSIGPVWDGNEVWLITAGGALFAAFPDVYATAFSGFYLPFMFLLIALIFRAVSIEFRSKETSKKWRQSWDIGFSVGSILSAILFGVAIGNVVMGFHIAENKEFMGSFFDLLTPYTVLAGLFALSMFAMHGAIYLNMKTDGELQEQTHKWAFKCYYIFIFMFLALTASTLYLKPEMVANFSFGTVALPGSKHDFIVENQMTISVISWLIVLLNILSIANIHRSLFKQKHWNAFISSSLSIGALIGLFALGIFPNMMVSNLDPNFNLDIYNSSSSVYTLKTMFYVAIFGMPFVLSYTFLIYWTYRGKTVLNESSY